MKYRDLVWSSDVTERPWTNDDLEHSMDSDWFHHWFLPEHCTWSQRERIDFAGMREAFDEIDIWRIIEEAGYWPAIVDEETIHICKEWKEAYSAYRRIGMECIVLFRYPNKPQ